MGKGTTGRARHRRWRSQPGANASSSAPPPALYWFVDDTCVGHGAPDAALSWQPRSAGHCDVRVVDDHGRSDERALGVSLVQ